MFIKEIDYLSPSITFYHNKKLSHSSIFSGILSIFTIFLIIVLTFYYSMDFIYHQNPEAFYFVRFIEDAGVHPLNSSSLFHFISVKKNAPNSIGIKEELDFTKFRVIGINQHFETYLARKNLRIMDHWIYGKCNDNDIKGINDLINVDYFTYSACIRKYYNSTERKYYTTNDPNFYWPTLAHGTFNNNQKFYNIFLEKCSDDSLKQIEGEDLICSSDTEIYEYFDNRLTVYFNFIDEYIDMLNYKEPIKKFLFKIESSLDKNNYFMNHLNFNPTFIKTHGGFFFKNTKEKLSLVYDRNDVNSYTNIGTNIYAVYRLWMNNREQHYERFYKKMQDIVSNIGGIGQCLYIVSKFINYIFNCYIVLSDTKSLLLLIQDKKELKKGFHRINVKNILNTSKNKLFIPIPNPNKKKKISLTLCRNNKNNISTNNNTYNKTILRIGNNINENIKNNNINNTDCNKVNEIIEENGQINFWNYFIYRLFCKKKDCNIKIYEDFRAKVISEEEIFKAYFNNYNTINRNIIKDNSI